MAKRRQYFEMKKGRNMVPSTELQHFIEDVIHFNLILLRESGYLTPQEYDFAVNMDTSRWP